MSSFLETIKIEDGVVCNIAYHQKRYESVLKHFKIANFENLQTYIKAPKKGVYRCRVVYTLGGVLEVSYHEYKKREINSFKLVYDDALNYQFKSADRDDLNSLFQKRGECDEIIIVKNSLITDTSIANIALKKDGVWFTPKSPLLKGTTRERYLEKGFLVQKDIKANELHNYSHIALMNAMIDFDIIASDNVRNIVC